MKRKNKLIISDLLFLICRIFPIKNKVVATTMRGRKYGDNPKYILDELRKQLPHLDYVWLTAEGYDVDAPDWIRTVPYRL